MNGRTANVSYIPLVLEFETGGIDFFRSQSGTPDKMTNIQTGTNPINLG